MNYSELINKPINRQTALDILTSPNIELFPLLNVSFELRKKHYGKEVFIHILNNVQNGRCPEDCSYCAQSKSSESPVEEYNMKSDEEILEEARIAHKKGAFRYCMVFSGTGPSDKRIAHLAKIVKEIKSRYPIEVCVSPGIIDQNMAKILKEAGLDRLNHNLNTSKELYPKICTTHTFDDRLKTLNAAKAENLQICSGVIIGMGETPDDIINMALMLKDIDADSVPVNFFIPIEGTQLGTTSQLTPEFCLRVLCLFRLINPKVDLRVAAGREMHLRDLQPLAFYVANSFFLEGYLNAKGSSNHKTLQMLKDAGFNVKTEYSLDELLGSTDKEKVELKNMRDLHPSLKT